MVYKNAGDDLDQILFEIIESKYKDITGENIEFEEFNTTHAEKAKKALSTREHHQVKVGKEIIEINRKEFEEAIETLVLQTEVIVSFRRSKSFTNQCERGISCRRLYKSSCN